MYDLGSHWLFVDGQCRYWANVMDQGTDWLPVHGGVLGEEDERALASDFHYSEWRDLQGDWGGENALPDGSVMVFHDGEKRVTCAAPCFRDSAPTARAEAVRSMALRKSHWVTDLYARGAETNSAQMRLVTYPGNSAAEPEFDATPQDVAAVEWPLSNPIQSVAVSPDLPFIGFGESFLVNDLDAVTALRRDRARFLRGELGPTYYEAMVTAERGSSLRYFLYFRDVIPLENDRGLVPVP